MDRLTDRVALVTGGASGIGRATCLRLASEGASVVVADIDDDGSRETADLVTDAGGTATVLHLDVTSEQEWGEVVGTITSDLGGLDILVNNAGIGDTATLPETSLADYEATIAVTQTSVFLGMRAADEALHASDHGAVVNISSIFGASGGFGTSPAYHAAKGAVRLMTKNTAVLWAGEVRVNSVHPGFIDTPMMEQAKGTEMEDMIMASTPMGRLGQPEEVADAIAWLASDDASFVTGSEVYVDGGYLAR